jgi:ribosomal protein L23
MERNMSATVLKQISALRDMSMAELKEAWGEYFDVEPPKFNRINLERKIAYRIQELAFGGLSKETKKQIQMMKRNAKTGIAKRKRHMPPAGTIIVREYQGIEHRVTVLSDGFEYQNMKYTNLSVIARVITGTRWSGPVFFGLKRPA